jgi:hypothetical protein
MANSTTADSHQSPVEELVRSIFTSQPKATAITAKLIGSDTIICAGKTTVSPTPILALCRELIAEGFDLETSLAAYRDDRLALSIRSIGEAATLEINARGTGFIGKPDRRIASPVRQNGQAGTKGQGQRAGGARRP